MIDTSDNPNFPWTLPQDTIPTLVLLRFGAELRAKYEDAEDLSSLSDKIRYFLRDYIDTRVFLDRENAYALYITISNMVSMVMADCGGMRRDRAIRDVGRFGNHF